MGKLPSVRWRSERFRRNWFGSWRHIISVITIAAVLGIGSLKYINQVGSLPLAGTKGTNWPVYSADGFSFRYPSYLHISKRNMTQTEWSSDGQLEMALQTTSVGVSPSFLRSPLPHDSNGSHLRAEEPHDVEIGGKQAIAIRYSCNAGCADYVVYFDHLGKRYVLGRDITGGGVWQEFKLMLNTFDFHTR